MADTNQAFGQNVDEKSSYVTLLPGSRITTDRVTLVMTRSPLLPAVLYLLAVSSSACLNAQTISFAKPTQISAGLLPAMLPAPISRETSMGTERLT